MNKIKENTLEAREIKIENSDDIVAMILQNSSSSYNSLFVSSTQSEDHDQKQAIVEDKIPNSDNEDDVNFKSERKQNLSERIKGKPLLHQREIAEIIERNYKS